MNEKARALGMTATRFTSPHGLPPSRGQEPDVSTARDLALLSRHLIERGQVLDYSAIKVRMLRAATANPFEMRSHNHLLGKFPGCDGLKTGYFRAAGFSLAATAERNGRRLVCVVLGSDASKRRDFKVMELLERGFAQGAASTAATPVVSTRTAPSRPVQPATAEPLPTVRTEPAAAKDAASTSDSMSVTFRVIPPANTPKKK
jgi:serine-type D-Ala-D-Ala carboxypeptidase (penicillin-binding protein 5/6)